MDTSRQYNWCPSCWFNADIIVIPHSIYDHLVCKTCGICVSDYRDGTFSDDPPRFFSSDEEFDLFFEQNLKQKD